MLSVLGFHDSHFVISTPLGALVQHENDVDYGPLVVVAAAAAVAVAVAVAAAA